LCCISNSDPDAVRIEHGVLIGGGCSFETSLTLDDGSELIGGFTLKAHSFIATKTMIGCGSVVEEHAKLMPYTSLEPFQTVRFCEIETPTGPFSPLIVSHSYRTQIPVP
jgi:hypothetical protein